MSRPYRQMAEMICERVTGGDAVALAQVHATLAVEQAVRDQTDMFERLFIPRGLVTPEQVPE